MYVTFWWKGVAVNWIYIFCQHLKCVGFIHRCSYLDKCAELTFNVVKKWHVDCLSHYISCIFFIHACRSRFFFTLWQKSYFLGSWWNWGKIRIKDWIFLFAKPELELWRLLCVIWFSCSNLILLLSFWGLSKFKSK